jgi:hypothetical protein
LERRATLEEIEKRTFSYLYGTPVWKMIKASSPAVAALNGLWCLIATALIA